jgi:hypothetical protein
MSAIVRDKPGAEKSRTLADATKEAASDAFKRACKYLGIARYLWDDVGWPTYYRRFARDLARLRKEATAQQPTAPPAPRGLLPGVALYRDYCQRKEGKDWADKLYLFGQGQNPPFPASIAEWDERQCEAARGAIDAGIIG